MHNKNVDLFSLVRDINSLWQDVYPHLAQHIAEVYGAAGGAVMEVGPFCGVIHELARQGIGDSFFIASFPEQMKAYYAEKIEMQKQTGNIAIIDTDPRLHRVDDGSIDLLIFRGALFFPSLFTVDYRAIQRVLKPQGCAFIGGGFGKYTPPEVISPLADRSRELNLLIGKKEVTTDMVAHDLRESGMAGLCAVTTDGGLWIIMRKEDKG
jgi:hypothetical protein